MVECSAYELSSRTGLPVKKRQCTEEKLLGCKSKLNGLGPIETKEEKEREREREVEEENRARKS